LNGRLPGRLARHTIAIFIGKILGQMECTI
jgi:hypothetical protein